MSLLSAPASHAVDVPHPQARGARRYRPDIQGLRAVAVLLVVLYHAGVPLLSGGYVGVDVFFVISGYLITSQLAREVERTGRVSLWQFYSRRFRRLLPPAALVVVSSLLLARVVLPYQQLASLTRDAFYTAVYGINFHLAHEGVNYQAATLPPSPLQHFWSLAVEEQFYAFWPLLMLGCAFLGRRAGRRRLLVGAIAAICVVSLYLSVTQTPTDGSLAYFGIHTRAWELGAGALLALATPKVVQLPDRLCRLLGWAGLAAVLVSAFVYDDRTPFPGTAALLPVLGAVAILAAGTRAVDRSLETTLLDGGVMQYLGRSSYAWYLWHWPLLILLPAWWGHSLNLPERLEVVFIAFWFAVLTYFLENASARSLWRAGRWIGVGAFLSVVMIACTSLVAILMPNLQGSGQAQAISVLKNANLAVMQKHIARSLDIKAVPSNLQPTLAKAPTDSPAEGSADCFADLKATSSKECTFGDPKGQKVAVLLGDSHADQWLNSLETTARTSGWKIVQLTKAACPVARLTVYNDDLKRTYTECSAFQSKLPGIIAHLQPDLIIASEADAIGVAQYSPDEWASKTLDAMVSLAGSRSRLVYVGDSPYTSDDGNTCLENNLGDARKCVYQPDFKPSWGAMYSALGSTMKNNGVGYIDTHQMFCSQDGCPPIVDNMLTHRDQGHVTNTYATWLAPMFAPIFETGDKK